jgi:hypothetical protein
MSQWVFLADATMPGVSPNGPAAASTSNHQEQQPPAAGHESAAAAPAAGGNSEAPCVLAVQLAGPKRLVDFLDPSDASCLLPPTAPPPPAAAAPSAVGAARRASGALGAPAAAAAADGGEVRLLRLGNLLLSGSAWATAGGTRLVNARGGETVDIRPLGPAKARLEAPALVDWARAHSGALRAVQEQLQRLVA